MTMKSFLTGLTGFTGLLFLLFPVFLIANPVNPVNPVKKIELARGEVSISLETSADRVLPASDFTLTLTVDSPSHLKVVLPDLRERLSGFSLAEGFPATPIEAGGRTRQVYRWRLVPEPAAPRYRLAPFAVTVISNKAEGISNKSEAGSNAPITSHFSLITSPVVFPGEGERPAVTGSVEVDAKPIWIRPTSKTVALWIVFTLFGIAALVAVIYGLRFLSLRVKEYRMSPIERAMVELQRLLGRNLPGRGLFKDFYVELTMVVRRYIERTHGIRAPGQTTQEFLAAAAKHPQFSSETVSQLRAFLESADMVKFAGQEATIPMTDEATTKAKTYITADAVVGSREKVVGRREKESRL
jgi:hypothetical protein